MTEYQKHLVFMKGWTHGAGRKSYPIDLMEEEVKDFEDGYILGQKAFRETSEHYAQIHGVTLHEIKPMKSLATELMK